jgi:hypothetical protein
MERLCNGSTFNRQRRCKIQTHWWGPSVNTKIW